MRKHGNNKRNTAVKRQFNLADWLPMLIRIGFWLLTNGDGPDCPTN